LKTAANEKLGVKEGRRTSAIKSRQDFQEDLTLKKTAGAATSVNPVTKTNQIEKEERSSRLKGLQERIKNSEKFLNNVVRTASVNWHRQGIDYRGSIEMHGIAISRNADALEKFMTEEKDAITEAGWMSYASSLLAEMRNTAAQYQLPDPSNYILPKSQGTENTAPNVEPVTGSNPTPETSR